MSNLTADGLSRLHTLPHPQLNLMPQSSELHDKRIKGQVQWCQQVKRKRLKKVLKVILGGWRARLTSSSLERSNSRPLSLNMATWCGPSLSVTCRDKMSTVKDPDRNPTALGSYTFPSHIRPRWNRLTMLSFEECARSFFKKVCLHRPQPVRSHIPWQESGSSSLLSPGGRSWPARSSPAHWSSQHSDRQPQPPETQEEEGERSDKKKDNSIWTK